MIDKLTNVVSMAVFVYVTLTLLTIGVRFYNMNNGKLRILMYWKNFCLAWATFLYFIVTVLSLLGIIGEIPFSVRLTSSLAMIPFCINAHYMWLYIRKNPITINE